jgi:predicted nucleic acid-binding protein
VKPKGYLETTVVSYLTSRPSRDIVVVAHQELTRQWWETSREGFEVLVSELVLSEASRGDPTAAEQRRTVLVGIEILETTMEAVVLAEQLIQREPLPRTAAEDALHIAIAVTNGVDYLLTWNCAHIANAAMRRTIDEVCIVHGYQPTVLCTPEELLKE